MSHTIVALSSGRPPAAVAIIRSSGPAARVAAEALAGLLPPSRQASVRTLRDPATGDALDTVLLLVFSAPNSATGEDIVEYHCHGGRAVVTAILDALTSIDGIRLAEPGEFTRRALVNGRIDLTEAEGLADLLEAETEQQRRHAVALAGGALSRHVDRWQAQILSLSARAEAAIDYVGDEEETATDISLLVGETRALGEELGQWLALPRAEPLKDGVRIVFAGPPNSGKSSLVNALVGVDRAIVTPVAGTTRDTIEIPLAIGGMPLLLVDTAGLRGTDDPVEAIGVERAYAEVERAEVLVWLGDAVNIPDHPHAIVVRSKSDLPGSAIRDQADLAVSAKTGNNLALLTARLMAIAASLLPGESQIALNSRQAQAIESAANCLLDCPTDLLLLAESLRSARFAFDRLTGRAGIDDVIDALFSRFCLGK